MDYMPSIDLAIPEKLRDPDYRRDFFLAETSAQIARQLIELRKLRELSQTDLALKIGTRQAGVSRVESADYGNWSFNTLRKIAEVLDARLKVIIEPAEAILHEYIEDKIEETPLVISDVGNLGEQRKVGASTASGENLWSLIDEANISRGQSRNSSSSDAFANRNPFSSEPSASNRQSLFLPEVSRFA